MSFDEEQLDYIVCRAAFKNFAESEAALRALIIDLRRDASPDSIAHDANEMKQAR